MTISPHKAKKLALALRRENREGRSWREIAAQDYGGKVHYATLNRIALHKGEWLPKDVEILTALGLITPRSPYAIMPRWWERTPEALRVFKYIRNQAQILSNETRVMQYAHRRKAKK